VFIPLFIPALPFHHPVQENSLFLIGTVNFRSMVKIGISEKIKPNRRLKERGRKNAWRTP
jgi:hypothetical protein